MVQVPTKGLTDEALGLLVDRKTAESVNWYNSKLSREREKVTQYYNGDKPERTSKGSTSFISTEVYDAVESMKAQLLETFSAGREIVKFDPLNPEDVEPARIATAYTDYVIFSQNDGYNIFNDVIHDGLVARVGVVKVYWEECYEDEEEEFKDYPEEAVLMLSADDSVVSLDATQDPVTGLYSGTLKRREDESQVKIEVINPEEFAIEPHAKYLGPEYFCVHRTLKSLDQLLKMGYKREDIEKASRVEDAMYLQSSPEVFARFQQVDSGYRQNDDTATERNLYILNEAYVKCRRKGDKEAKLWKVTRLGNQTLDTEEIDDLPFLCFRPLPIPHAFYGNNFAARVIPAQDVRTVLTRAIVDHASITVNPRYTVLKGALTNPRELLDNRLGGLVNVTRPDAVSALEQAPLNPFVYQTLELIKSQNEQTTGISSLSQGLNKDAISKQNSDAMVERLVGLSQTRQKIIARNFANDFLIPLFIKVYNLVVAKEKKERIIDVAGNWVPVNPETWEERRAASVSLHLGYKEHENEAQKLMQLSSAMVQHPLISRMVTPPNAYKLAVDVMKLQGHGNFNDYITDPSKLPPPQPDPIEMQKLEIERMKAEAALVNAQASMKKVEMHGAIEVSREQMQEEQNTFNNMVAERDMHRKDLDIANKVDVAQREIALAESTPIDKGTTIVSPR